MGAFGYGGLAVQPGGPPPETPTRLTVGQIDEEGTRVYRLLIDGDESWAGVRGVFYRSLREIRDARVIEVEPPQGRVVPEGSNRRTQLALWHEFGEDGKLWPQRATRHAGSWRGSADGAILAVGNWDDFNEDLVGDLGFVCIGEVDHRIKLNWGAFNPVAISGVDGDGHPQHPETEPWSVGEPIVPEGLSAATVPAYDVDGDGRVDETGYAGGGCHIYLVQFVTQALPELLAAIDEHGGTILDSIPSCSVQNTAGKYESPTP